MRTARTCWSAPDSFKTAILFIALFASSAVFSQTVIYSYDNAGRLVVADYGTAGSITYVYDNNGNRLQRTVQTTGGPPPAQQNLSVSVSPAAGSVTAPGINCPGDCTESYLQNTQVLLSAAAQGGFQFLGWGGALSGQVNPQQIQMQVDKSVTAYFGSTMPGGTDGDGLPDAAEFGPLGKNPSFDGNNDGTPDYQQDSVASFPSNSGGGYVTLSVPAGQSLGSVTATANPSPGDAPADSQFPYGFFDFTVSGLSISACTTATLLLPPNVTLNTYYKYGPTPSDPTPHWYVFLFDGQVGAQIIHELQQTRVVLNLCDGLTGDADLTANGIIVDPGGPAITVAPVVPVPTLTTIGLLLLVLLVGLATFFTNRALFFPLAFFLLFAPLARAQTTGLNILVNDGDPATGTVGNFTLGFNSLSPDLMIDASGTVYFSAASTETDAFGSPKDGIWTAGNTAPAPLAIVEQVLPGYSTSPLSSVSNLFFVTPGGKSLSYVDSDAWLAGTSSSNLAPILTFGQIPAGLPAPRPGEANENMFLIGLLAGSKAFGQPGGGLSDYSATFIGNPAPSIAGMTVTGIPELGNFAHNPTIANDRSDLLFQADISDASVALYLDSAATGVPTRLLARSGSTTPGIAHGIFLKAFWPQATFYAVMNDSQQGLFTGSWRDPSGSASAVRDAIWRFDASPTPVLIASVWRDPAKDLVFTTSEGSRTGFSRLLPQFSNPVIAPNGDGYFMATGQQVKVDNSGFEIAKTSGIWRAPAGGGNLELIYRAFFTNSSGTVTVPGTILPDGSEITNIIDFGMSPEGQLIIKMTTFKSTEGTRTKLFAQDFTGGLHLILSSGEVIEVSPGVNKTVGDFTVDTQGGLSGTAGGFRGGKIAIRVQFQDNSVAILSTASREPTKGSSANCNLCSGLGEPINTSSGELYEPLPADINLGGPMPLVFQRYYAAYLRRSFIVGDLGNNWRHNFDGHLYISGNTARYVSWKGRVTNFIKQGTPATWGQTDNLDTTYKLIKPAGQNASLFDPQDNLVYSFDYTSGSTVIGKLTSVADGKGNVHTVAYTAAGQIQSVSDGLGRTLTFTYNTDVLPKISIVTDGTRSLVFQYTDPLDTENLTLFTDVRGGVTTYSYKDTSGTADKALMKQWTLPRGNVPFIQVFDMQGRVTSQTNANGDNTDLAYGVPTAGKTTITDPLGVTRVHSVQSSGAFSGLLDPAGQSFSLTTDTSGRRKSLTDRLGDTTTMNYHAPSGKLAGVTNADGTTESFAYTPRTVSGLTFHDMSGATNADGSTTGLVHDVSGNLTSRTDQLGNTSSFTYNGRGQVLTATNKLLGVTTNTYKADGTLADSQDPAGNITRFGYDALKRPNLITYADASTRSIVFDQADHPLTVTNENGKTTTMTYDANGNLASVRDPLNQTVTFGYDGNDRLISTTDALGGVASTTYHPLDGIGTIKDANGNIVTFGYNSLGRLTSLKDPLGNIWPRSYDAEGIIDSTADPLGNTTRFVSDKMGRITQAISPLGNISKVGYDAMGRIATTTDALNQVTSFSRDALGQITRITLPGGTINTTITRNALGEPLTLTDPNGNDWTRGYDVSGRLTSVTDPLGQASTTTYDTRNRPATITFPGTLGTQTLTRDGVGNLTGASYTDGTAFGFSYDANNRLIAANNGGITANNMTRTYAANGRISNSNGITITRDAGGRILTMTLAPGKTVTYAYDANDRVTSVTDWAGGITTFTYDNASRLTGIARPNGINTTNTWDNDSRLTGISEGAVSTISLTRDAKGQITAATRSVPTVATLSGIASSTHSYDAAAQIAGNTYDALGRRTVAGADTFTWDGASRLTGYTAGGVTATNTYDALGRRIRRTVGTNTVDYVWNDALVLPSVSIERRGSADFRYFIHDPGGALLYSIDAATNARSFYHFDEMGNTIFISDDAGATIGSYAYTPFGQRTASAGGLDTPFTWQGRNGIMDEGNGLYYIRARFYDANTGRFISRDARKSIVPKQVNPYQYALNNPLKFIDIDGLDVNYYVVARDADLSLSSSSHNGRGSPAEDFALFFVDIFAPAMPEMLKDSAGRVSVITTLQSYELYYTGFQPILGRPGRDEEREEKRQRERDRRWERERFSRWLEDRSSSREAKIKHLKDILGKAREEATTGGTRTRATQDALNRKIQEAEKAILDARGVEDAGGGDSVVDELAPYVGVG